MLKLEKEILARIKAETFWHQLSSDKLFIQKDPEFFHKDKRKDKIRTKTKNENDESDLSLPYSSSSKSVMSPLFLGLAYY